MLNSLQNTSTNCRRGTENSEKNPSQGHSTGIFGVNLNSLTREGFWFGVEGGEQLNVEQNHE